MANKVEDVLKALAEAVAETKDEIKKEREDREADKVARAEEAIRSKENIDKALIEDQCAQAEKDIMGYDFLDAQKDVRNGKNQPYPLWDKKTMTMFGEYCIAKAVGDRQTVEKISKAAGPYTETTTAGGYLLPTGFRPELVRLMYLKSMALQKGRIIPVPNLSLTMPSLTTQASANWGTINTAIGDTVNVFGQLTLTLQKMVGLSSCPNELIQDSPMNVAQIITDEWTESFAKKIDEEFFQGDTSDATNHKFAMWGANTSVHNVTGDTGDSAAGALTLANLGSVLGQLEDGELEGAEWFMHPTTWARLRVLTGGSSGNDHPYVAVDGPYKYTLMGFPVNLSNKASTTWASIAASGAIALFGNPKLIYIGTKNDIQVDSSEAYKFNYDQTVFRAIQRIAMAMALPGSMAKLTRGPSS